VTSCSGFHDEVKRVGRPASTYIDQLCRDASCLPEESEMSGVIDKMSEFNSMIMMANFSTTDLRIQLSFFLLQLATYLLESFSYPRKLEDPC